jgi:hypothetical protein
LGISGCGLGLNAVGVTPNFLLQYAVKSTFYDKRGSRTARPAVPGRVDLLKNLGVIPGLGPDGGIEQNFVQ